MSAEIGMRIVEQAFFDLDAPIGRVCSAEVPIPYPRHLEEAAIPQVTGSSPPPRRPWAASDRRHGRVPHALARRRHGGGHAGRVAEASPATAVKRGDIVAVVETAEGRDRDRDLRGRRARALPRRARRRGSGGRAAGADPRGLGEARSRPRRLGAGDRASRRPPKPPPPRPCHCRPQRPCSPLPVAGRLRASPAARAPGRGRRGSTLATVTAARRRTASIRAGRRRGCGSPAPGSRPRPDAEDAGGASLDQMRAAIAAAMARSKREIPHYYLLQHHRHRRRGRLGRARPTPSARRTARLLLGALFVKAAAVAARAFPSSTASSRTAAFDPSPAIHVGVAVSIRGGGLVAPAIHDTADLALDDLMAKMRDLVTRVRAGPLPQLRDRRPDHHRLQPGRARRRGALGRHLPAAGGHRRLRQGGGAALGDRRGAGGPPRGPDHPRRRPPGQRRTPRRAVPGRDRRAPAEPRRRYDAPTDIRAVIKDELARIAPEIEFERIDRRRPAGGGTRLDGLPQPGHRAACAAGRRDSGSRQSQARHIAAAIDYLAGRLDRSTA